MRRFFDVVTTLLTSKQRRVLTGFDLILQIFSAFSIFTREVQLKTFIRIQDTFALFYFHTFILFLKNHAIYSCPQAWVYDNGALQLSGGELCLESDPSKKVRLNVCNEESKNQKWKLKTLSVV